MSQTDDRQVEDQSGYRTRASNRPTPSTPTSTDSGLIHTSIAAPSGWTVSTATAVWPLLELRPPRDERRATHVVVSDSEQIERDEVHPVGDEPACQPGEGVPPDRRAARHSRVVVRPGGQEHVHIARTAATVWMTSSAQSRRSVLARRSPTPGRRRRGGSASPSPSGASSWVVTAPRRYRTRSARCARRGRLACGRPAADPHRWSGAVRSSTPAAPARTGPRATLHRGARSCHPVK